MTTPAPTQTDLRPLSDGQLALWFGHLGDATKAAYQCAEYVDISGPLDADRWAEALRECLDATGLAADYLDT
ncbi:MAG: hypothetical protein L0H86_13615, partial [Micrococcaceae bacterium]|nr:hypothetical protein [Micrococcaceae bacterium]MDN5906643.1 hypothetical protein [Micrococcaceae bacterium]